MSTHKQDKKLIEMGMPEFIGCNYYQVVQITGITDKEIEDAAYRHSMREYNSAAGKRWRASAAAKRGK